MRKCFMKKKTALLVCAVLTGLTITGCAKAESGQAKSEAQEASDSAQSKSKNGKLTLEDVMNAPVTDEQYFTYKETEGGVIVLSCTCGDDIIVLPETLDGKPVVNIASGLFTYNATGAKGIYVADTIEVIPENAFSNCGDLEVLVLGTGVKVIERASIVVNENLRVISVLSDSLEEMGTHVIVGCGALEEVRFNGDCENVGSVIGGWGDSSPVIYGPADSNIEQYAKEAGWEFMAQ